MTSPGQQPQPNAEVNAFVDAVNGFSQAGGVQYPGVQVAGGTRDEHLARMLRLASDPGSFESARQVDGTYRIEINGVGLVPDAMNSGSGLPSMYPDAYVTGSGTTSNGLAYEDWSTRARATEVRASEIVGTELGPLGASAGAGSISAIGPVDGFFAFDPLGRGLKGFGGAALDTWLAAPRAVGGAANLIRDAWGYAANAVAPRRSVITGEAFAYEPKSALLQSVQRNGVAGTIGIGITGAVRSAPGIGLIGALGAPNRDWGNVGAQTFNTGLTAAISSLPGTRGGVADSGRAARYQTIDEVVLEVDRNADIATELARRAYQRGNITGSPQAFGTRAHSTFEGLNERLNRRLIGEAAPFRIAVEEFRDAAGIVTGRRAAGSIGADVRVFDAATGASVRVLDLKTHGGVQIPISPSRQQDFVNRFGLPAEEIYKQR